MKITGVLPIHNGGKFIDKSMPLILNTLNPDDELLIINNGSTDNSNKKLEYWANRDSRINLVTTEAPGLVTALNFGILESCNNWIARFDIDDLYDQNRLKHQRKVLDGKTVAVFTDYDFFSDNNRYLGVIPSAIDADAVAISLISSQRTAHSSVLFSKAAVLNVGGYRYIDFPAEDLSLWLRLSRIGNLISIPETLLHYRLSSGSITGSRRNETKEITKKLLNGIGINQSNIISLIENIESVFEIYKKHSYARERELLTLKELYYVSKNTNIDYKTKKKIIQILIHFMPKRALNIPTLQAINLLRKEQVSRNEVRKNWS